MLQPAHKNLRDRTRLVRRSFLGRSTASVGAIALETMLPQVFAAVGDRAQTGSSQWTGIIGRPHYVPQAKRVIHLYMAGGPSHLETFDYKPKLAEMHGEPMPESFTKGQQLSQLLGQPLKCFGPQVPFKRCGESGQWISREFPNLSALADELCVIRSMQTEQINHDPAHTLFNTGSAFPGRPSMGAWLTYGLGNAAQELPDFVVLTSVGKGGQAQPIAARQWSAGFLPAPVRRWSKPWNFTVSRR